MIGEFVASLLCAVDVANVVPAYVRLSNRGGVYVGAEIRLEQNAVVISRPPILELPWSCAPIAQHLRSIRESLASAGLLRRAEAAAPRPAVPIPELKYGEALEKIIEFERKLGTESNRDIPSAPR